MRYLNRCGMVLDRIELRIQYLSSPHISIDVIGSRYFRYLFIQLVRGKPMAGEQHGFVVSLLEDYGVLKSNTICECLFLL